MPDRSKVLVLPQRGDSQTAISPNVARGVQRGPQSFEESSRDKNPSAAHEQNLKVMSLKQEKNPAGIVQTLSSSSPFSYKISRNNERLKTFVQYSINLISDMTTYSFVVISYPQVALTRV